MTVYAKPGTDGSVMAFESRYENWIGGEWVPPVRGQYFENPSPVDGKTFCEVARSTAEDIELALDAAHAAAPAWGKTPPADRALALLRIADRMEEHLEKIAFSDVLAADDGFLDRALEGFTMFAFNQGEVCTCPSRALIQENIYDDFMAKAIDRVSRIRQGNPLDTDTQMGAQASNDQFEKITSYLRIGKEEGATVLIGGEPADLGGDLSTGFYIQPTVFEGRNRMRIFQEEIFGPVLAVTTFSDYADAISIANDTLYGLGAGVWSREGATAYRAGREIQAGRVWTNTYHDYPAHAAFGGYKQSGIGRETHLTMLEHYQQTKNLLVGYAQSAKGFF